MTIDLLDVLILLIALVAAWQFSAPLLIALIVALVVMLIVRLARGHRLP